MRAVVLLASLVALVLLVSAALASNLHGADIDDNDFAEFEDFDDDDMVEAPSADQSQDKSDQPKVVMAPEADMEMEGEEEDGVVEDDEDEFEHLQDEEEFEGFDREKPLKTKGQERPPDLKITSVPHHLRTNWDSFYLEMLMLGGLGVYLVNFLAGKAKNSKLATAWLSAHKALLEENFSIVGDDGTSQDVQSGVLMKESENAYALWCSGRVCCEGMLVTLKLLKRQDIVSTISRLFRPAWDQIIVKMTLDPGVMDPMVFCLGNKKILNKMQKEMVDLACFCSEKKRTDMFGLPPSFHLIYELQESAANVLDNKVVSVLSKYEELIEYIHVSDQYSGPKQQDDTQTTKVPETSSVLIFCFNAPGKGRCSPRDMESMKPLMHLVFYMLEKIRKVRLSKDAKQKADKNRVRLAESYSKASHLQRSELAQERREKKRRDAKDKMMSEDDPDKQRKLEDKYLRKDARKKQPKVKMMKVKAM